jgi:hypothetical protein
MKLNLKRIYPIETEMANLTTEFNMNKAGAKSIIPLSSFFNKANQGGFTTTQPQPFTIGNTTQGGGFPTTQPFVMGTTTQGGFTATQPQPFTIGNTTQGGGFPTTQPQPFVMGTTTQKGGFPTQPQPFTMGNTTQGGGFPATQSQPFVMGNTTQKGGFPATQHQPFTMGNTTQGGGFPATQPQPFVMGNTTQGGGFTATQPQPFVMGNTTQGGGFPATQPQPFVMGNTTQGGGFPVTQPQPFVMGNTTQGGGFPATQPQPFVMGNTTQGGGFHVTQPQPFVMGNTTQKGGFPATQPQPFVPFSSNHKQEEFENFLYSDRYNNDSINQTNDMFYINLGHSVLTFEVIDKLEEDTYKLKDKNNNVDLAIRFGRVNPCFSQCELNSLKIRPIGKKLFNKDKNRLDNCYFMESYDGSLYKYFSELKRVIGERSFGNPSDISRILHIVDQVRKRMVSLYEMNNRYAYTDLKIDNIVYKYRENDLNDVDFRLLVDRLPYDSENIYLSTYPPIDLKTGEMILSSNEDRVYVMSWQLGILLLSFVGRHMVHFNRLNWIVNNSFTQSDYTTILNIMKNSYGDRIVKYLHNIPSERPSIFESLI